MERDRSVRAPEYAHAPSVNIWAGMNKTGPGGKIEMMPKPSSHTRFFFPCTPRRDSDMVQMWRNATGSTEPSMTKSGFFCPGWLPWDPKSEFSRHFGYPTPFCTDDRAPTDRSIVGTVAHETWVIVINYAERNCPTFLAAATQGITVTAVASVLFIILYALLNVVCGCTRRLRQGQSLDLKGVQKDAIDDMPVLFPSSASNFREVVELKDVVARQQTSLADLKDVVARQQRELADLKEFCSLASASAEGTPPRMYYPPSSGSRSDVEAPTESELINELALVHQQGRSRTMGAVVRRSRGAAPPSGQPLEGRPAGRSGGWSRPAEEPPLRAAPPSGPPPADKSTGDHFEHTEQTSLVSSGSGTSVAARRARGSQISSQYGTIAGPSSTSIGEDPSGEEDLPLSGDGRTDGPIGEDSSGTGRGLRSRTVTRDLDF